MITQLVYTSRPNFDPSDAAGQQCVAEIVKAAHAFNGINGITGFLLVGTDWFAQVLEGPSVAVSSLFHKILKDKRHSQVRLIDTRLVMKRQFADWDMGVSRQLVGSISFDTLVAESGSRANDELPIDRIIAIASREMLTALRAR